MTDMVLSQAEAKRLYEMLKEANGAALKLRCEIASLKSENARLTKRVEILRDSIAKDDGEKMRKALQEISLGAGPFSEDPLTHASNTIEAMKDLAKAALEGTAAQEEPEVNDIKARDLALVEAGAKAGIEAAVKRDTDALACLQEAVKYLVSQKTDNATGRIKEAIDYLSGRYDALDSAKIAREVLK